VFSSRLSYDKAAYVLRMLRFTVGDSVFFEAINNYLNDTQLQYSFVTTNHFIQHIEAVANQDLSWFFNQWIYGEGFPSFNITWSKNNYHWVKIKVNQSTSHHSVPFYRTALPLTFKNNRNPENH
jgi:aminopeptidase N